VTGTLLLSVFNLYVLSISTCHDFYVQSYLFIMHLRELFWEPKPRNVGRVHVMITNEIPCDDGV